MCEDDLCSFDACTPKQPEPIITRTRSALLAHGFFPPSAKSVFDYILEVQEGYLHVNNLMSVIINRIKAALYACCFLCKYRSCFPVNINAAPM